MEAAWPAPRCPECGAAWPDGHSCQDDFHQLLAWESEDPQRWAVHHLMALCYHLQHPSLYSPAGLAGARQLLVDFMARGLSPEEVRRRDRSRLDSSKRTWKIKGTPDAHGSYGRPLAWPLVAAAVVAGGPDAYCANVRAWAESIQAVLQTSEDQPRR